VPKLTIVARIKARPEQARLLKSELLKLIDITRAEKGCLQYDLHQDNADPSLFMFYEHWESRELWQEHMSAPHLQNYGAATAGAVEDFTLNEMTLIG